MVTGTGRGNVTTCPHRPQVCPPRRASFESCPGMTRGRQRPASSVNPPLCGADERLLSRPWTAQTSPPVSGHVRLAVVARRTPGLERPRERREPEGLQGQARPREDARALQLEAGSAQGADLRRAAARRTAPPLRLPAGAGRRARLVGGAEGCPARAGAARARGARRGSPARLRDVRGRDPEGQLRRRHGRDLGQRHLRARRGEARRRPHRPPARHAPRRHVDVDPGASRREGAELAPHAQAGRDGARRAQRLQADARDALRGAAERRRLALRGEVGRLSRARAMCAAASRASSRGTATT